MSLLRLNLQVLLVFVFFITQTEDLMPTSPIQCRYLLHSVKSNNNNDDG